MDEGISLIRNALRTTVAAPAAALALATLVLPASAQASTTLPCKAWMSNSTPKQYTTTDVKVSTVSRAKVKTVAHYRTTSTTHYATASSTGKATIAYRISRATPGYKVKVSVTVRSGTRSGSCSTSFTPHA